MSTKLMEVVDRVKREPGTRLLSLAHLLDEEALAASFHRLRKAAAVGVDGIKVEQYGQALEANIQGLHERMKAGRYRHQPILRVQILKENGKMRPIGISTVEDKVVQGAVSWLLERSTRRSSTTSRTDSVPVAVRTTPSARWTR